MVFIYSPEREPQGQGGCSKKSSTGDFALLASPHRKEARGGPALTAEVG